MNGNYQHQWDGYIARLAVWPCAMLANSQLQQITAAAPL
jgi:hypothetical protein